MTAEKLSFKKDFQVADIFPSGMECLKETVKQKAGISGRLAEPDLRFPEPDEKADIAKMLHQRQARSLKVGRDY